MKITANTVLRDEYDVVIIGAGLGGMTAACLLAKRGLTTLVIEQQDRPGGSCTSFKDEDVVYDVGTAMLYGFGEKGFKPFRFLFNEIEEPIQIIAHDTLARLTIAGQPVTFYPDLEQFLDELGDMFPPERENIARFYADLYKMYENIVVKNEVIVPPSELSPTQGLRQAMSDPKAMLKMQRLLSTSTRSLLEKYFHTPEIFAFYDKLCSAYCYTTAAETPAVLAATMFLDNHIGGVYYPAGGAQMLPSKLEKSYEQNGGQMLYRQLVDEIVLVNNKAIGVKLADGTLIKSRRVIANATVWNIYGKLIKPEHISAKTMDRVKALVPTFPSMTLYLLVDREAIPMGILPWEIFIENRDDIDSQDLTLYVNSLVDETISPPGTLAITVIAPNMEKWPAPGDPAYQQESYARKKKIEAEKMLDQIESHIPGFRRHILRILVGTPSTIERFLLKNSGAVGGPKNQLGQEMLKRLHARSEYRNLYYCGDSTVMATGAPATVVSGVGAANMVLRDLHKKEYDSRKYTRQFVEFVQKPYRRQKPPLTATIDPGNAASFAAECQWCRIPDCRADCPAGIDIPGFMRRIEAGNIAGAARLIREKNPFGESCGYDCGLDAPCTRRCYRKSFAERSVRIPELQRWVCAEAGMYGWLTTGNQPNGEKFAMLGTSPAGLTCAFYLALAGRRVRLYGDPMREIVEKLSEGLPGLPYTALLRDLDSILAAGIEVVLTADLSGVDLPVLLKKNARVIWALESQPKNHAGDAGMVFTDTEKYPRLVDAVKAGRQNAVALLEESAVEMLPPA